MSQARDEDLFAGTSMSFGAHLEELRSALVKSLIGLLVAFIIGLLFLGKVVVSVINGPLEQSLQAYYKEGSIIQYDHFLEEQQEAKLPVPYTQEQVRHLVRDLKLVFTMYQVHPSAVRTTLGIDTSGKGTDKPAGQTAPEAGAGLAPKAGDRPDKETIDRTLAREKEEKKADVSPAPVVMEPLTPLFVWQPVANDERASIKGLSVQEGFMFYMKASLMAGVLLASPWIFYQLWNFVSAGLYPTEKRFVHIFLPISLMLFLSGAAFCFFVIFPFVLDYLFKFNRDLGIAPDPRINEWLGFAVFLPIGFGLSFQLPLVMLFLNRIGMMSVQNYLSKWKISVLVIFVISMVLTPADPVSMLAMAIPLTALYFGGILICQWAGPRKNPLEA